MNKKTTSPRRARAAAPRWPARIALAGILALLGAAASASEAGLPKDDRVRLAEAFRLSEQLGDVVWPGWNQAPFAVLLVTPEFEYLVRHDRPSEDFVRIGYDELLKSEVYRRPRQFPVDLLATFPAVGGVSTIVIGQAANTEAKDSTSWVTVVMHEHFHQLQHAQPGYFSGVTALGLARGDRTGMWMLNFPFPYASQKVVGDAGQLVGALRSPETSATRYVRLRDAFMASVAPDEARYAGFQLWQEGLARYTEIRVADWAAAHYVPSKAFAGLPDYRPFAEHARSLRSRVDEQLAGADLARDKRLLFYAIGAAEGLLLDRTVPGWQKQYFDRPFDTRSYFAPRE